jgi:Kef-type K+ transport system membrane component KefB
VSKLGITKNISVNISVGSTLITNVLALLVLAIIVGMSSGVINHFFWIKLSLSFVTFFLIIMFVFPLIARWFFKRFSDSVSQYIFVLVIVFLGAVLSQLAGIEAIIGAFLAGLALNRFVPRTSPLMNRIDFVGNAIFIPFFLIGVGMLIDYRAFINNSETLKVAIVMSVIATLGKFLTAWLTQKSFKFSLDERRIIFGLTNAQAAATLAAVLVGYNIILGHTETGEPIRLLSDSVLNGTIVMILITCTIASFATQKGAQNIAISGQAENETSENPEKILISISNPKTIEELINLSTIIKSSRNKDGLFALNILTNIHSDPIAERNARKLLEKAEISASATDIQLKKLLRYDVNSVHGITNVIKEQGITDLVLGLHVKDGLSDSFLGKVIEGILHKNNITTYVYNPFQPISTIKRHVVIIPENAEYESGFSFWLAKIWNIGLNTRAKVVFYSAKHTLKLIQDINGRHPIKSEFNILQDWNDLPALQKEIKKDDNIILVLSRKNRASYNPEMNNISYYINNFFKERSFILVYPMQKTYSGSEKINLSNPSLIEAIEKIDIMGKTIAHLFKRS